MSAFWEQKMKTYFIRIDFDNDGAITRKDFEGMGARFAETGKLSGDNAKALCDKVCGIWDQYLANMGGGAPLTQDAFVAGLKKVKDDANLKTTLGGPMPIYFAAVDANNDGMIQAEEFAEFFKILGLDPALAIESFKAIDTNNDGLLSVEEFSEAGAEFFTSEDESKPTKLFWGPLV